MYFQSYIIELKAVLDYIPDILYLYNCTIETQRGFHLKIVNVNLLKPIGYGMHQQVEYFNNCTLCPNCIHVFCICLRANSDLYHLPKTLIGFYNRDEKRLQRGTDWVFK
jgi:hypothetical protein